MIAIHHPSLALNSDEFSSHDWYNLQHNELIPVSTSVSEIVDIILRQVAQSGTELNVVMNAHGLPGEIYLGAGILECNWSSLQPTLNRLRGQIANLYLCCCKVASGPTGRQFCQQLADLIDADVIASEMYQLVTGWDRDWGGTIPQDFIDDFEGYTWRFSPGAAPVKFSWIPVTVEPPAGAAPLSCPAIAGP